MWHIIYIFQLALISSSISLSILTRSNYFLIQPLEIKLIFFILIVILLGLSLYLLKFDLTKIIKESNQTKSYWWNLIIISGLFIGMSFIVDIKTPAIPQNVNFTIINTGEKNNNSKGNIIEILNINQIQYESQGEKTRLLESQEIELTGAWEHAGFSYLSTSPTDKLVYKNFLLGSFEVEFKINEYSGIALIQCNDIKEEIDLYSPDPNKYFFVCDPPLSMSYFASKNWIFLLSAIRLSDLICILFISLLISHCLYQHRMLKIYLFYALSIITIILNIYLQPMLVTPFYQINLLKDNTFFELFKHHPRGNPPKIIALVYNDFYDTLPLHVPTSYMETRHIDLEEFKMLAKPSDVVFTSKEFNSEIISAAALKEKPHEELELDGFAYYFMLDSIESSEYIELVMIDKDAFFIPEDILNGQD